MPFDIVNQNEYLLIKLTGECNGAEKPTIEEKLVEKMKETQLKLVIVQCTDCSFFATAFIRQLSLAYREIKILNGQIRLVGANPAVLETVKRNGLDRVLVNKMSLRGALVDFGLVTQKAFDVNFINPFLAGTQKVLKVQCGLETRPQKPTLKKPTDPLLLGDVSGIISIASDTFNGTLAISVPEAVFLKIGTHMLGESCSVISESNVDLIGELANMILGIAKVELAQLGYALQQALPSCVWGKDHKIKHFGGGICVVIPFETDFGTIFTEVMTRSIGTAEIKKAA